MKKYRAYIMNTSSNLVRIFDIERPDLKSAKRDLDLRDDEILLKVESVVEKAKKERAVHACMVTYVWLERAAENEPFELRRNTIKVTGTDGTGKSRNSNIRYMAKKGGNEIPTGAIIESVEPCNADIENQ